MNSILIVEDERGIYEEVSSLLDREGFLTDVATCVRDAVCKIEKPDADYDLVLLDLRLPDGYGMSVLREAKNADMSVIVVTAVDDEYSEVDLLELGADDYICKPYRIRPLVSRINNVLRRKGKLQSEIVFRSLRVDTLKGVAYKDGVDLDLTKQDYKLLLLFMQNIGVLLSRNRLLELWDKTGRYVNDNTLTTGIKRLREKIEDDPKNPQYLVTVHGMGYRFG